MKLSTKGRYAMVALVDLATSPGSLTTLAEISRRQDISLPYLEQLFVRLRRGGLVDSVRQRQRMVHTVTPLGRRLLDG